MNKLYLGVDTGSIYTKGVIIDEYNNIISSSYILTNSSPIESTKKLIKKLKENISLDKYTIVSVGVTGTARKLIGALLNAGIIKNEIYANVTGTLNLYPETKTIIEIGGQDSKIIYLKDKAIIDYSIYNNCTSIRGSFLTNIADKLNVETNKINELALLSKNKIEFKEKCSLFAETDIINKIISGYSKEDILAGISHWIAESFINNINTNIISGPIVFNGGVSKNIIVHKDLENHFNKKIIVNNNSHLISAYGMAILARSCPHEIVFNYDVDTLKIDTKITPCKKCNKECLIVSIYRNDKLIDYWGNKCNQSL